MYVHTYMYVHALTSGGLGMKEGAFGLNPLLVWWGGLLPGEQLVLLELELALLLLPLPCCCSAEEEEEGSLWSDRTGLEGCCWPLAPRDDCWWMPDQGEEGSTHKIIIFSPGIQSPHTSQLRHCYCILHFWLLVPGLSSHPNILHYTTCF